MKSPRVTGGKSDENSEGARHCNRSPADCRAGRIRRTVGFGQGIGADVKQYCGDVKPGKGAVKDCARAHYNDLSSHCQMAIVWAAAVGKACKACKADKQFCGDVKPGKEAVADCIKSHASEVSDECKDAIAKAEAGNK